MKVGERRVGEGGVGEGERGRWKRVDGKVTKVAGYKGGRLQRSEGGFAEG